MKKIMRRNLSILTMAMFGTFQAFADKKIQISSDIDAEGDSISTGLNLGFKILIIIFASSVVFGVIKGLISYATARDQEKKQILASTVTSAVIAFMVALALFSVVALFMSKMGMGNVFSIK